MLNFPEEAIILPNGTTFVGNFTAGKQRELVSNGEVATATFAYTTAGANAPVFGNQLPVSIDLSDISIPGTKEWDDGEWSCEYMRPGAEFIRILDTSSLADNYRYTYISEEFIIDNDDELIATAEADLPAAMAKYQWAIGWWKYPLSGSVPNYFGIIEQGETEGKKSEYYLSSAVPVNAGCGFIGNFTAGKTRQVNFPSAIDVPSKK